MRDVLKADAKVRQQSGQSPLRNIILGSVVTKMVETRGNETEESQQTGLRHISNNLHMFVERVHHENYPDTLIAGWCYQPILPCARTDKWPDVAHGLTNLARKTADWPSTSFFPDPFLKMSCLIVRHNKASSRVRVLFPDIESGISFSRIPNALGPSTTHGDAAPRKLVAFRRLAFNPGANLRDNRHSIQTRGYCRFRYPS